MEDGMKDKPDIRFGAQKNPAGCQSDGAGATGLTGSDPRAVRAAGDRLRLRAAPTRS